MEYKVQRMPIERLTLNTGQIDGLPANPRQWTGEDVDKIAHSLEETPELFDLRPIIAVEHKGKHIILAGSLRFCGAKKAEWKEVPVIVLPESTDAEKMKEIVIKDNGSWGAWDYDALANEWDAVKLTEWGVPAWAIPSQIDEGAVDDLFTDAGETKEKDIVISIEVPLAYEDIVEDIRKSVSLTLDEWKGCRVK